MPCFPLSFNRPQQIWQYVFRVVIFGCLVVSLSGCEKKKEFKTAPRAVDATVIRVEPQDTPIVFEFIGQTESSRQVEIRARVDGFLERQAYKEGTLVHENQVLFEMDKGPFEAALQQAEGELALQRARLVTAQANLKRIRPLAEKDAVSQKDLDDAVGAEKQAQASVLSAEGLVREAKLNLGYTTITSPVTGLASKAEKQEGSYIPTGPDSLLTYVAQLHPIWVNFSVSENQILRSRQKEAAGFIQPPADGRYEVEAVLADGTIYPHRGRVNFAEPSIDPETGTMLIRAELANPDGTMRPGQFIRVRLHGAIRPHAILVPQTAVMQGAKGHFVWVVNKEGKAEVRAVAVGPWHGKQWFIDKGLRAGDLVIIDNLLKLSQGVSVKATPAKLTPGQTAAEQLGEKTE